MLSFPVRAEDAVFLHAQTASCPQQVGAVVMLNGPGMNLAGLRSSVAARVGQLPQLRRRLIPARGRWHRPRWVIDESLDVCSRVTEAVAAAGTLTSLEQVVGRYFAEPVDPAEAAWQLLLVRTEAGGPSAIVVKAHHALGDSYALISELSGLFDQQAPRPGSTPGWHPDRHRGVGSRPARRRGSGRSLAGPAPHSTSHAGWLACRWPPDPARSALAAASPTTAASSRRSPSTPGWSRPRRGNWVRVRSISCSPSWLTPSRSSWRGRVSRPASVRCGRWFPARSGQPGLRAGPQAGAGHLARRLLLPAGALGTASSQETGSLACCSICRSGRCLWLSG